MNIWNKILLGLITLVSLAFFYMAARTLKTHQAWRSTANAYEKALQQARQEQERLAEGGEVDGQFRRGLRQVRLALDMAMRERGRVWKALPSGRPTPQGPDGSFEVLVKVDAPERQITVKMILYVFEEELAIRGGKYLGEFKVEGVDEAQKQITLKPTRRMEKAEYDRVVASNTGWFLYERLPLDSRDLFAGMTETELREVLPESVLPEFLKDGKPWEQGDPEDCLDPKTKLYVRQPVDFERALAFEYIRHSKLVDQNRCATTNLQTVTNALTTAEADQKRHEKEVADTKAELAKLESERKALETHLGEVVQRLAETEKKIAASIAQIQSMVGEIARIQLEATRKINERTQAAMQAGAGK